MRVCRNSQGRLQRSTSRWPLQGKLLGGFQTPQLLRAPPAACPGRKPRPEGRTKQGRLARVRAAFGRRWPGVAGGLSKAVQRIGEVLTRLPSQPHSRIGELLPHRWQSTANARRISLRRVRRRLTSQGPANGGRSLTASQRSYRGDDKRNDSAYTVRSTNGPRSMSAI